MRIIRPADLFKIIMEYKALLFDNDGFWDSEQCENELPIQFWKDDVPDQEHLDVLLKAWNDQSVYYTAISGDSEEFDAIEKLLYHKDKKWYVCWNGNMSVEEIKQLSDHEIDRKDCTKENNFSLRIEVSIQS